MNQPISREQREQEERYRFTHHKPVEPKGKVKKEKEEND